MSGGKVFICHRLAYLQLPLDDNSKELVTINTHKGVFQYNRLLFGVSAAPAVFQRRMERLLQGCTGVSVYLHCMLYSHGSTMEDRLVNLDSLEYHCNSWLEAQQSQV